MAHSCCRRRGALLEWLSPLRCCRSCCRLVNEEDPWAEDPQFLLEVMVATYERRKPQVGRWSGAAGWHAKAAACWHCCSIISAAPSALHLWCPCCSLNNTHSPAAVRVQTEVVNEMPVYPTEAVLFDENQVPSIHFTGELRVQLLAAMMSSRAPKMRGTVEHAPLPLMLADPLLAPPCHTTHAGEGVLALPKLNLQFLTLGDYLLRNFNLFRLEATYEIREDLTDVLTRIKPFVGEDDQARVLGRAV